MVLIKRYISMGIGNIPTLMLAEGGCALAEAELSSPATDI